MDIQLQNAVFPMSETQQLESLVISEFSELRELYGFNGPYISRETWVTRIDYLKNNLGIEFELDWRDYAVFLLIVRLENGALPEGYYVSHGRKCRKHIETIAREHRLISSLPLGKAKRRNLEQPSMAKLKQSLVQYKTILFNLLPQIEALGEKLFD